MGRQGYRKVKIKKLEFFNSDCRFRFLAKKYECKVVFIFLYSDVIIAKIKENVKVFRQESNDDHLFANLDIFLDFSCDNI